MSKTSRVYRRLLSVSGRPGYIISVLILSLLIFPEVGVAQNKNIQKICHYGVFPYLPVKNLEKIHAPMAKRFSEILGCRVKLSSRPTFELFRNTVATQIYDIIYIQPFGYIRSGAPNGYIPLARFVASDDKAFKGLIQAQFVTLSKSSIKDASQLKNRVVAMPSADAAVSLLGRDYLNELGLFDGRNIMLKYQENHFSCLEQLVILKASACVSALPPIKIFEINKKVSLRIFAKSRAIPSSLIAVHRRISKNKRLLLQKEIIDWKNTRFGKALLKRAELRGFIATSDKDYDVVRKIWKGLSVNE